MSDEYARAALAHTLRSLGHAAFVDEHRLQLDLQRYHAEMLATPRYSDRRRVVAHGSKTYSQNDEDGILAELFRRLGPGGKTFFEFGVADGLECNTLALLVQGWRGLWAEPDPGRAAGLEATFRTWTDAGALRILHHAVTPDNIDRIVDEGGLRGLDLLSIDVDGNDLWVWKALTAARPRVVVVEYNATWPPPLSLVVPYDPAWRWDGSNWFGASLAALQVVGEEKGYRLVGCCFAGVNAFFVREDLCSESLFLAPFTAEEHYEPARYFMSLLRAGHRPGAGPVTSLARSREGR